MAVKNATTRKKIATVKFTEAELQVLAQILHSLEYEEDARSTGIAFQSAQKKVFEAKGLFGKYT